MNPPSSPPRNSALAAIGQVLVIIYIGGFFISTFYCNWQFAHKAGFAAWFFFGQIVPTLQAFAWPIDFVRHLVK